MVHDPGAADLGSAIEIAIRKALRPLVRLWIEHSLRFPFAAELLKILYVQVAAEDLPVHGRDMTDSRINFLTGVHRKDVRRLRGTEGGKFESPAQASLSTQLIARWTTQAAYLDSKRKPRALPRVARGGRGPSFEGLVRELNTDIRPRVVLDEWRRLGIAELDERDRVHLKTDAFIPAEGSQELAYYFGRNLHDHIAAAVHNVLGAKPAFLERSVNYNNLTPAAVEELDQLAHRRGMELLQEINARALLLQRQGSGSGEATNRANFGIYFYSQNEAAASLPAYPDPTAANVDEKKPRTRASRKVQRVRTPRPTRKR